jgi:flavin reductase (NADH)
MADVEPAETMTAEAFRALMAGFPTGVVVVTTLDTDGQPLGLTCSSLCSVSLDPPLLLVCIANHSRTLAAMTSLELFAVNMLHREGRDAAHVFSTSALDRFRTVAWSRTPRTRLPCLVEYAHAIAECRVRMTEVAGDHTIVVGEVLSARRLSSTAPLMYGLREYAAWPDSLLAETGKGS